MEEKSFDSGRCAGEWELLRMFKRDFKKFPVLSREEEIAVARRAKAGDQAAADLLVESNLRFVLFMMFKYWHPGLPFMDLISEGCAGLVIAAKSFDPEKKVRFISYAAPAIAHRIYDAIGDYYRNRHDSLDEPLGDDGETTPKDLLAADGRSSVVPQVADRRQNGKTFRAALTGPGVDGMAYNHHVRRTLFELEDRSRRIILLRYWCDLTREEVAARVRLSPARVAQIENIALQKMRWALTGGPGAGSQRVHGSACVAGCGA